MSSNSATPASLRRNRRSGEPPMTTLLSRGRCVVPSSTYVGHARRLLPHLDGARADRRRACRGWRHLRRPTPRRDRRGRRWATRRGRRSRASGRRSPRAVRSRRPSPARGARDPAAAPAAARSRSARRGRRRRRRTATTGARRDPSRSRVVIARSTASRLPPWPLTSTTPPDQSAERTSSTITVAVTSVPIDSVPGKPACSPLAVTVSDGPTTTSLRWAASRAARASATIVSVSSGRCGPCCSHDPTGMHSSGRPSVSDHVISVSCTRGTVTRHRPRPTGDALTSSELEVVPSAPCRRSVNTSSVPPTSCGPKIFPTSILALSRCASPSRRPASTSSTRRSGAASPVRCRRRSCR